ncbi:DUF1003 domain-containing protein [Devosia insulae]|nr:DUF1003 domain-containing protein [Devosia insulae]
MSETKPHHDGTEMARRFTLRQAKPVSLPRTYGEYLADQIAALVGSWRFIITQSVLLALWIVLNVVAWVQHWDPYPFILLNLVLSFQAAFTAPILMMAQNRQSAIDRQKAQLDYDVNLRAELDIEALHQKIDLLRQEDITRLVGLLEMLTRERMEKGGDKA